MATRIHGDGTNGRIYGEQRSEEVKDTQVSAQTETEDKAAEEEEDSSPLRKVAVGAGIAGLVGIGATVYAGHKTHEVVDRFGSDVGNAVGELIMSQAGPVERRLPAIGAKKPDREEREQGYEFDV